MKIQNWIACVHDRGKWKEFVEKAKTFNQEFQCLEEEEEKVTLYTYNKQAEEITLRKNQRKKERKTRKA